MIFFHQLIHVLGCRATGSGFKQSAPVHQRNNAEHLGARSQFEDGEEVCQVITEYISCDRYRVQSGGASDRESEWVASTGRHDRKS